MTPLIATHAFAALTSLLLGAWQLYFSTKGSPGHRWVGRVWVPLMLFVAVSSFWIRTIRDDKFSFLHVLSVVTIVTVSLGILNVRRGDIRGHLGNMVGSWIGLTFAFIFAIAIPQRHIPRFVVSDPAGATLAGLAVLATSVAVIGAGRLVADAAAVESRHA